MKYSTNWKMRDSYHYDNVWKYNPQGCKLFWQNFWTPAENVKIYIWQNIFAHLNLNFVFF